MAPLEDYALLGDMESAALVSTTGSIDWLCLPRFDAPSCFAALLGTRDHGRWLLGTADERPCASRAYRDGSLVLDSRFETETGAVTVTDCMPPRDDLPDVIRVVRGEEGRVSMRMELVIRFDYGAVVPWVRRVDGGLLAVGGPDALYFETPVQTHGVDFRTVAEFDVAAGEEVAFRLTWFPSHQQTPTAGDPRKEVARAETWWREWAARLRYDGEWAEAVAQSLTVLKALTYHPTGGLVAAATTSLPEDLGGVRNWDYRYCWLRDATFTLDALLASGHTEEAEAWRDWLCRAVAGDPSKLQIMYGASGERRLTEWEVPWLPGYEGSRPVRIGNAASNQFQLDVYGEVLDSLHQARRAGIRTSWEAWDLQRKLLAQLEEVWREPDEGIWEVRSGRQHFVHSKVMAWVGFDRGVKAVEQFERRGPVARWRALRDEIHDEVCQKGWSDEKQSFVQHYGSSELDASLLIMPIVGFLPPDDPRVVATVEAIERELMTDGFVRRYRTESRLDGVAGDEGAFLMCTFWLADCLQMIGRTAEAREIFERLLTLRNDVGLLSEQYDTSAHRLVGNFPQAFSHVALVNTARNLSIATASEDRRG
jgi:GH15 family glucan-1,4-alpha-glucosidase